MASSNGQRPGRLSGNTRSRCSPAHWALQPREHHRAALNAPYATAPPTRARPSCPHITRIEEDQWQILMTEEPKDYDKDRGRPIALDYHAAIG